MQVSFLVLEFGREYYEVKKTLRKELDGFRALKAIWNFGMIIGLISAL